MLNKFKSFLVEGGHMSDSCRDVSIDNARTDFWKDMELAGEDRMGSKKYVAPDTYPQPCNLYLHQPRQFLLETLRVGFNFIAECI
jgi:hypothetical protein